MTCEGMAGHADRPLILYDEAPTGQVDFPLAVFQEHGDYEAGHQAALGYLAFVLGDAEGEESEGVVVVHVGGGSDAQVRVRSSRGQSLRTVVRKSSTHGGAAGVVLVVGGAVGFLHVDVVAGGPHAGAHPAGLLGQQGPSQVHVVVADGLGEYPGQVAALVRVPASFFARIFISHSLR